MFVTLAFLVIVYVYRFLFQRGLLHHTLPNSVDFTGPWEGAALGKFYELRGILIATVYKAKPIFTGLRHGKMANFPNLFMYIYICICVSVRSCTCVCVHVCGRTCVRACVLHNYIYSTKVFYRGVPSFAVGHPCGVCCHWWINLIHPVCYCAL